MPIFHVSEARTRGSEVVQRVIELGDECIQHFFGVRGKGNGVGNGSCCASVRLKANDPGGYPQYRFGSSQARHLDHEVEDHGGLFNPQNHAERVAHAAGKLAGGYTGHIFVELPPCSGSENRCEEWCNDEIPEVFVWYMYHTTEAMEQAHAQNAQYQCDLLRLALNGG